MMRVDEAKKAKPPLDRVTLHDLRAIWDPVLTVMDAIRDALDAVDEALDVVDPLDVSGQPLTPAGARRARVRVASQAIEALGQARSAAARYHAMMRSPPIPAGDALTRLVSLATRSARGHVVAMAEAGDSAEDVAAVEAAMDAAWGAAAPEPEPHHSVEIEAGEDITEAAAAVWTSPTARIADVMRERMAGAAAAFERMAHEAATDPTRPDELLWTLDRAYRAVDVARGRVIVVPAGTLIRRATCGVLTHAFQAQLGGSWTACDAGPRHPPLTAVPSPSPADPNNPPH